jgi:hypothetical protein
MVQHLLQQLLALFLSLCFAALAVVSWLECFIPPSLVAADKLQEGDWW